MNESDVDDAALADRLRCAGCVFAEDEARILIQEATSPAHLGQLVAQRLSGVPLEQVVGWAEFAGGRVRVTRGVFVPRRRSEVLVNAALRLTDRIEVVVDLCCGSGAVGAALHRAWPDVQIHAVDIDPAAVACARLNLPTSDGNCSVWQGDLFDALPAHLRGEIHLVVANAPYVPTEAIATLPAEARDHEPWDALDGGADGTDFAGRIAADASHWLTAGGRVILETSAGQAETVVAAFAAQGYDCEVVTEPSVDGVAVVVTSYAGVRG